MNYSAYLIVNYSHIRARHDNMYNTPREILENKTLSSCRESIEWNYNDLKTKWSYIDFKNNLRLMRSNVILATICAFIFRNAHVCMNGNITSEFFSCVPPTIEDWTYQGPRPIN